MFKKLVSIILLSCIMVTSTVTLSFANETNRISGGVSMLALSESKIAVSENGITSIIDIKESSSKKIVEVSNDNREKISFVYDKINNTLYSSITGETFTVPENDEKLENLMSSRSDDVFYKTFKMSYATMARGVGTAIEVATIIAMVVAILKAPWSIDLVEKVGDMISTNWSIIVGKIEAKGSGGIATDLWKNKRKIFKQGTYHYIDYAYVKRVYRY